MNVKAKEGKAQPERYERMKGTAYNEGIEEKSYEE